MAPVRDLSNVATPTKAIITIPITLMDMGMVMMPKKGGPAMWCDGREHGEHKRDKARR